MNRPSFQFYPGDWRSNTKLRRCSEGARGAWIDILCVLHDSDEYGLVRWFLADLVRVAGVSTKSARELVAKDVLKGADRDAAPFVFTPTHAGKKGVPMTLVDANDGPVWYSSRMVRDEYVRQHRGQQTRFVAEPKATPMPGIGAHFGDGASSSASSSKEPKQETVAQKNRRRRSAPELTIADWLTSLGDADAISHDDPILEYAEKTGIPQEFLELNWQRFVQKMTERGSRQKDWRRHYRNCVRDNWLHLWYFDTNGECKLTVAGEQARRVAA